MELSFPIFLLLLQYQEPMETPGDYRTTRTDSTLMNMQHNSFSHTLKVLDYQIRVQIPFIFPRMKIRLQFTVCIMKHALGRICLIWAERLFPSFGVVPYQTLSFYLYILICAENAHDSKIKSNAQLASRKRRKSFQLLVIIWMLLNLKGNYTMIQFQILRRNSKRLYHQWIAHRLFLLVLLNFSVSTTHLILPSLYVCRTLLFSHLNFTLKV